MSITTFAWSSDPRVLADPSGVRAVDGDEHPLADVLRQLAQHVAERHELELRRHRRRAREVHQRVLLELPEPEAQREHRAQRVPVGVLVGDDEKAVVRVECGKHPVEVSLPRLLLRVLCHL